MTYTQPRPSGGHQILIQPTFVDALAQHGNTVLTLPSFSDVLQTAENLVLGEAAVHSNAFNRARGTWYEWLISVGVYEYDIKKAPDKVMVQLPNRSSFDCGRLYTPEIFAFISDLRNKVETANQVSLITSNPDFAIIRKPVNFAYPARATMPASDFVHALTTVYTAFVDQCELDDICAYAAAKLSVRGDRRLQIPHEGSLMKALYRHIQTRQWIINAPGIKYYAMMAEFGDADADALNTVATHSIVDVGSEPQSAVDEVAQIDSGTELEQFLDVMLA